MIPQYRAIAEPLDIPIAINLDPLTNSANKYHTPHHTQEKTL
jgi:hypothetical protein